MYKTNWTKGGNIGAIIQNGNEYIAITAAKSKAFKTLAGAEGFMKSNGYKIKVDE